MSARSTRLTVAALLAALALAAAASAQKVFRDDKHGYQVKTVAKWVGVPIQPTEKHSVAKWASERDERGYPGRMFVHIFDRGEAKPPTDPRDLARLFNPPTDSFASWIRRYRRGLTLPAPEQVEVAGADGTMIPASLYTTEYGAGTDPRQRAMSGYYTVVLVVTRPEREFAVELYCGADVKKRYRRAFRKVVDSFRLLGPGIQPTAAPTKSIPGARPPAAPGSGEQDGQRSVRDAARAEARRRAREDKTRVPGWWYVESENYLIVTNTPAKKKDRIRDLKRRLEAMRTLYEHDFPPREPIQAVSVVRVCKDISSYHQYGGRPGTGGYWYSAAKELVLFHRGDKNFARGVLNHEAFHQYIYYACGEVNPHIWYNEGHADYYGGADVIGTRAVIKPNRSRVDTIKTAMRTGEYVPLPEFLGYSQGQDYSRAGLCYAQGWSLAYFLNLGIERGHPWGDIVATYYRVLLETGKSAEAHEAAFRGVDLAALDEAWKAFIIRKKKVKA